MCHFHVDATYLVWKFWYSYTEDDDYTDAQGNTHTHHYTVNVYHWAPEEYSVSGSQNTSRQIKYFVISSPLDLKVLNKVKVDNGAYGSINYDQNATKYDNLVSFDTLKKAIYGEVRDSDSSDNLLQKYAKMGKLSEDSPIWKTTGYLVVGFDITTMNEGHEHLRYGGDPFNSLNMWKGDGQPKTDGSQRPIQLDNGGFTSEKTVAEWRANKRENQPDKATIELQAPRYEDSATNNGTVKTTTVPIDSGDVVFVDLRYTQNDKYKSRIFMIN